MANVPIPPGPWMSTVPALPVPDSALNRSPLGELYLLGLHLNIAPLPLPRGTGGEATPCPASVTPSVAVRSRCPPARANVQRLSYLDATATTDLCPARERPAPHLHHHVPRTAVSSRVCPDPSSLCHGQPRRGNGHPSGGPSAKGLTHYPALHSPCRILPGNGKHLCCVDRDVPTIAPPSDDLIHRGADPPTAAANLCAACDGRLVRPHGHVPRSSVALGAATDAAPSAERERTRLHLDLAALASGTRVSHATGYCPRSRRTVGAETNT